MFEKESSLSKSDLPSSIELTCNVESEGVLQFQTSTSNYTLVSSVVIFRDSSVVEQLQCHPSSVRGNSHFLVTTENNVSFLPVHRRVGWHATYRAHEQRPLPLPNVNRIFHAVSNEIRQGGFDDLKLGSDRELVSDI